MLAKGVLNELWVLLRGPASVNTVEEQLRDGFLYQPWASILRMHTGAHKYAYHIHKESQK